MSSIMEERTETPDTANTGDHFRVPLIRKRPLRTYGRQPSDGDVEALPPKRQRGEVVEEEHAITTEPPTAEPQIQLPELPKSRPLPKGGSILSYFKRLPPKPSIPPAALSDSTGTMLTPPPSSPTRFSEGRKRRRLTMRPTLLEHTPEPSSDDVSKEEDLTVEKGASRESALDLNRLAAPSHASGTSHEQKALSITPPSKLNVTKPVTASIQDLADKKKMKKRSTKAMVQTTLNLSRNPDSGFAICKECDVLYNPLNESDRKEHKKQHAAYLRRKAKASKAASP